MDRNQAFLRHFLAAIAYRSAKALRDAPAGYEAFQPGHQARTPRQLVRHMSGVINYAIGLLSEPRLVLTDCATYAGEVARFFALRLSGSPIPPEDFFAAAIDPERLSLNQVDARSPDAEWPEAPDGWSH